MSVAAGSRWRCRGLFGFARGVGAGKDVRVQVGRLEGVVMAGNSAEAGRSVASKVIAILQAFTHGGVHSLTEIAHLTGLPISTVHRLATELAAGGVLERTEDAHYRVGLPLQVIGSRAAPAPTTVEWARRGMDDLAAAVHADVRFGFFEGLEVAFIEKVAGQHGLHSYCGAAALPAHATALGKALLAFSPPGTVEQVIARGLRRYTAYTLTTADRLRRALAETRLGCVALSRWELQLGTSGVAAPVFGAGGRVTAALEVRVRDPRSELPRVQPALQVAARALSRELAMSQITDRYPNSWPRQNGDYGDGAAERVGAPVIPLARAHGPRPTGQTRSAARSLSYRTR
jgi:DNA-binding IclR family transcriptional regulator